MNSNQTCALVSTCIVNANLDALDFTDEIRIRLKDDPQGVGREFAKFVKAGLRMPLGDLKIATAPFDVKTFVGDNWKIDGKEQDARSQALTEVDFGKAELLTCLNDGEPYIKGEEKLLRLKKDEKRIRYGATVFMGLWLDYKSRLKESVLEKLYQERGITRMYFFGDVLVDPRGDRDVLYVCRRDDGTWGWSDRWLGSDFGAGSVAVVSPQVI